MAVDYSGPSYLQKVPSNKFIPFCIRFGSYVHLYIRSMVEEVFNLVREYEKEVN